VGRNTNHDSNVSLRESRLHVTTTVLKVLRGDAAISADDAVVLHLDVVLTNLLLDVHGDTVELLSHATILDPLRALILSRSNT